MLRLPRFSYLQPTSIDEALRMKQDAGPDGMYVAGGTDLYPNMKRRHQEPKTVISLAGLDDLHHVTINTGEGTAIGAGTTLRDIETHAALRREHPVVAHAAELVATPLLRNMGTVGGNLCLDTRCNYYNQSYEWRKCIDFCMKKDGEVCWVAPSSPRCWAVSSTDLAPVMVALDARYTLVGPAGDRQVGADGFYNDDGIEYLTKQPGEILADVRLPAPNGWDATYWKLRRRGSFDFPVLGVAAWVAWDGDTVRDARIVLGGVASLPKLVAASSEAIVGSDLNDDAIAASAQAAFKPAKPMDNTDFGLAWRKEMTRTYVKGALEELRTRHREA
jgi:4-hydroxybenzoyl-CoA reductase subunit beta